MEPQLPDPFETWEAALERRHCARLTFGELRRSLAALSSIYVERRGRLSAGAAMEGEGKRAAFALFYGPLHFLTLRGIVRSLRLDSPAPKIILDLGCGTGVAGAAWALECRRAPSVRGWDRSAWASAEARWSYARLRIRGVAKRGDFTKVSLGGRGEAVLAAFSVNELAQDDRQAFLDRLLHAARRGSRILVVEPIARRGFSWWDSWAAAFLQAGGRSDTWRFEARLPETIRRLDEATGMDHRELTARSLSINP